MSETQAYTFQDTHSAVFSCPAEALANLLGRKWVPQIIEQLAQQELRFGELCRKLPGSTPKMIKQQLNLLEQNGIQNGILANEKVTMQNTTESTYFLTTKGQDLFTIVKQMKNWGQQNLSCNE